MATKKRKSGASGATLDRTIKSLRTKISAINKKRSQEKAAKRKQAVANKLKTKLKSLSGGRKK